MGRSFKLKDALSKADEPRERFVVATRDGRTLDFLPDNQLGLDVGDSPKHWSQEGADVVVKRWNEGATEKDRVTAVYWRDHYIAQAQRLDSAIYEYWGPLLFGPKE
jgi:hypothetical protein